MHWPSRGVTANSSIWNIRYTNILALTFTEICTIFYEYNLEINGAEIPPKIRT